MAQILKKALKYKNIPSVLQEGNAHLRDPFANKPEILRPVKKENKEIKDDDITDFPIQKIIPIPESIPYQEGKYRPASVPLIQGLYPHNCYLEKGKVYSWCSCGMTLNNPFCDTICNKAVTRNRPVTFNVDETGYYKLCQCKNSSNAPFCNGTHIKLIQYQHTTHRGFLEIWGFMAFVGSFGYMYWNYYT